MAGPVSKVVGLMGTTVIFSVVGAEITNAQGNANAPGKVNKALTDPVVIIVGGTIATALLVLISELGEVGQTFGVGLAGLALVVAALVNGGPVWRAISNYTGGTPTASTTPTTPTGSTKGTGG